jgi:flagellar biogenesis protein FliO
MLQQINFFECMGVLFTAILAILFGFVIWGFFKVRSEMKKKPTTSEKGDQQ